MAAPKLFGTSGIRGDSENFFTNQLSFDLGRSFAKFLDNHHQIGALAVGMDPRGSSPRILGAVEQGLAYCGKSVFDQGASPVPAINLILKSGACVGSIMVSGSHITQNLNGLKFFAFGEEILKEHEQEITDIYQEIKIKVIYRRAKTSIEEENRANENYEEMLVKMGLPYPRWKAIVDPGNGAQSDLMPRVLKRLGLTVVAINDELQGGFIARDTETQNVLEELQKKVLAERADFGVAYDADGDRVVFVNEKGEFVHGDYSGALLAKASRSSTVVTPINTSQVVEHLGKTVIRTRVGSPYVVEAMKKSGATFGFEANGGGISREIMMSRDGGSTTIKILNLLVKSGKTFSGLVATLPHFYINRLKVDCPTALNITVLKEAKKSYKGIKTEEVDGLKIWIDNTTWILFRPSSNAPEFRVFVEAVEEERAKKLIDEGILFVNNIILKAKT